MEQKLNVLFLKPSIICLQFVTQCRDLQFSFSHCFKKNRSKANCTAAEDICIYGSDKRKSKEYKADDESKDSKDTLKATTITTLNKSSTSASHGKQEELLEEVDIEMYSL